jgi:hypothetical protein
MENWDMAADRIAKKILARINQKVHFTYPAGEEKRSGLLKDRCVERANPRAKGVPYWSVVDLIGFGEKQQESIRFGYYRKPGDRLNWASQTTATFPIETWKRLFVKAAREKPWFRKLLEEVMNQLHADSDSNHR